MCSWGGRALTRRIGILVALLAASIIVVLGSMLAGRYYGMLAQTASPQRASPSSEAANPLLGVSAQPRTHPIPAGASKDVSLTEKLPLTRKERPLTKKKPPPSKKITSKDHRKARSLTADDTVPSRSRTTNSDARRNIRFTIQFGGSLHTYTELMSLSPIGTLRSQPQLR